MSLVRWTPFTEFDDIFNRFSRLPAQSTQTGAASSWLPPVDVRETSASFHIDIELPSVAVEDVLVEVKEGVLNVSGERKAVTFAADSDDDDAVKSHRSERRYGQFSRSFRLPDGVDEDAIEATAKDGVLYLTLAKKQPDGPRQIEVKVH